MYVDELLESRSCSSMTYDGSGQFSFVRVDKTVSVLIVAIMRMSVRSMSMTVLRAGVREKRSTYTCTHYECACM